MPCRLALCLYLALAGASPALALPPAQLDAEGYAGSSACASCHGQEYRAWKTSHHDLAMQEANANTVLGNFANATFNYNGTLTRFYRKGGDFWLDTEGPDGKLTAYQVKYVFGVKPLQQYLLQLSGGRLQALSIAWDTRPVSAGGQRWFHLYPDEAVDARDPLHWTGPYQNWNSRCAECHSTRLEKNYDPATQAYSTTWFELNVGCEACHGPAAEHAQLARAGTLAEHPDSGLAVDLRERGEWVFSNNHGIASRSAPLAKSQQVESCGRCHARRGPLGEYHYGQHLLDTHRLSLLEDPLYYADGQIRDEVYVYGSFRQSKMYQAGVVCSNCHDPHSNQLRAPDNGVCAQCHQATTYDSPRHHHHQAGSTGAVCADCHMPQTTYMVVDPRRDHSIRVPRPDLSVVIGTPNACNQCHQDKTAQWAVDRLRAWGVNFADTGSHAARAMQQAQRGDTRAVPRLQQLAQNPDAAAMRRASAMLALGGFANREAYAAGQQLLSSNDPLLRLGAVRGLEFLPVQQRWRILGPHLDDPSKAVRMELARVLAAVPLSQLDPAGASELRTLFAEYMASLLLNADMPGVQLQMGTFYTARQQWETAEQAYLQALRLNPQLLPAQLNLADLYRSLGREEQARAVLEQAVATAPEQGAPWHALGLLESRNGQQQAALQHLEKAAALEQSGVRHRYVYAIALHDFGDRDAAITQLKSLQRATPGNPDILLALVNYCREAGRLQEARRYAEKLKPLLPDSPELQRLYDSL